MAVDPEEKAPFGLNWNTIYLFVILFLLLQIAFYYQFTTSFS